VCLQIKFSGGLMKQNIKAYAALKPGSSLQPHQLEPFRIGDHDVEVKVTHCGICHSDIHLIDNDWGFSTYPLVPGHEIVGIISRVGSHVNHLKPGQRVGIGWQADSCGRCEYCSAGEEHLCASNQATCVGRPGGFAEYVVANERFIIPVPDKLTSENAAPLLCGGVTVYSPMREYNLKPYHKVGVIGIGGLGHLAIQFASAFGCEVTAFSSSPEKEQEAKELGATYFVHVRDSDQLERFNGYFDFILSTVFVELDWKKYVNLLKPKGRLNFVGAAGEVQVPIGMLLPYKSVSGSVIGAPHTIREMFEFAARHGIEARTQVFPLDKVNEAIDKVRKNKARYRIVLKVNSQ
jgi:uncharacterized zinc-type alcohol dehydrogenase-like protein